MNEGSAWQLRHMLSDTSDYDDYFPSLFSQNIFMTEILPSGTFSWIKWKSDSMYTGEDIPTVSCCFSMLHTIDSLEWGGFHDGIHLGNARFQANSVRAYFNTEYLEYAAMGPYNTYDNFPERMDLNTYPVRMAGYTWQTTPPDSITLLGSATDLWMLNHYENLMDSTFIPAGTDANGPYPINYHPQAFGRTGGKAIWDINEEVPPDTTINYLPYSYRIPSPGEFRMLCNIGLLRGAKGVFPFSLRSYDGWEDGELEHHDTGLLDEDLIPFDAPYEDWVYRERPPSDYYYAPPDSIPPWTAADGSDFDPLYDLPDRPDTVLSSQQNTENFLLWKFAAYGRLWNSVRSTFGQIAQVAPELSGLWWWYEDNHYDDAGIIYDATPEPSYFADPHIRVFTDSTITDCYLFYVNRFCRADSNPFEITIDAGDFPPGTPFSEYALDHSRRFLVEGDMISREVYVFSDTLDAGEARLLQMFDDDVPLTADIRITDPDLFVVLPYDSDTLSDYRSCPGTPVAVHASFYNMGMNSLNNIFVYLKDETDNVMLDTARVSFEGLSIGSCYEQDRAEAVFVWTPDSTDIGVHRLKVFTQDLLEPDTTDNSATLVYIVDPRDYATEILDDPWDMTEAITSIPDWYTNDIDTLTGCWDLYTDSISGMFEGQLYNPLTANKLVMNTGSDFADYIDADTYINLSLAGRSRVSVDIEVHWIDWDDRHREIPLADGFASTAADLGPYDLSEQSIDWTGNIKKLWLEFDGGNAPVNVRIGWVKLTE